MDNGGDYVQQTLSRDQDNNNGRPTTMTLRQLAATACKRIDVGTAVMPKPLTMPDVEDYDGSEELQDAAQSIETHYARIIREEFNAIVVEHHLKWAPLCVAEPGPLPSEKPSDRLGRYDFHHADEVVDWALQQQQQQQSQPHQHQKMKIKGHVLVWAISSPSFVKEMEPAEIRTQLRRHIFTTMGHFRGRIHVWDVVNEPLAPDGSLAENIFLSKLGPSYIEEAFRWAHEADPTATLLLNENKVEGIGSRKSEAFYELLADLKAKDVPVHGVGLQAHFNAAGTGRNRPPTPRAVKQQIRRLGELDLTVNISEMDVRVSGLPDHLQQLAQRQIYHDIVAAALSEPAFDGIWLWGFTDRHTWVTHFYYDDAPLIFDEDYGRKEAYCGIQDALATLNPGGKVGGEGVLLDSDIDMDGNEWGHLWMQPEPELSDDRGGGELSGDARADWEQDDGPAMGEKELDSGAEADRSGDDISDDDLAESDEGQSPDLLPPIS